MPGKYGVVQCLDKMLCGYSADFMDNFAVKQEKVLRLLPRKGMICVRKGWITDVYNRNRKARNGS